MKLKDKVTIYIKNQKPISLMSISIITIVVFALIVILSIYNSNRTIEKNYTPAMKEATVRATFVGDVMMGRFVGEYCEKYGYDSVFKNISYLWKNSDYVSCNVESTIIDDEKDYKRQQSKDKCLFAKSDAIKAIKKAGFNIVSLANNHVMDYNENGMLNTLMVLKKERLDYVGAGATLEEAKKYDVKEINGLKVATLAISDEIPEDFAAENNRAGILSTEYDEYPELVKKAKSKADIVVVYMHWGAENSKIVLEEQEKIAKKLINSGADIIIGSHSHALQPIEKYKNGIIFYGLGNFVSDQGFNFTKESTLVNFSMNESGKYVFEVFPVLIDNATPEVTTNFYNTKRIFNTLTKRLNKEEYKIEDNKLIIEGMFEISKNIEVE